MNSHFSLNQLIYRDHVNGGNVTVYQRACDFNLTGDIAGVKGLKTKCTAIFVFLICISRDGDHCRPEGVLPIKRCIQVGGLNPTF